MTDDKGAGEGPYFHRCGTPGEKSNCTACAYEEGRKSMEKELEELLEFVNRIMGFFRRHTYCPRCKSDIDHTFECEVENAADSVLINFSRKCIDDFYVWKNARGIE